MLGAIFWALLMEGLSLVEQVEQGLGEVVAQKRKKGRTLDEKIGRIKWTGILLNRALDELQRLKKELAERDRKIWEELKEVRVKQRLILQGFSGAGLIKYTPPMLQRVACEDAVDFAILDRVFQAGASGILPRNVALDVALKPYDLKHYHVSRRIQRMNKRLMGGPEGIGELLFEKRGHRWALTGFGFEVWGESNE